MVNTSFINLSSEARPDETLSCCTLSYLEGFSGLNSVGKRLGWWDHKTFFDDIWMQESYITMTLLLSEEKNAQTVSWFSRLTVFEFSSTLLNHTFPPFALQQWTTLCLNKKMRTGYSEQNRATQIENISSLYKTKSKTIQAVAGGRAWGVRVVEEVQMQGACTTSTHGQVRGQADA